jgi:hypothetical protein
MVRAGNVRVWVIAMAAMVAAIAAAIAALLWWNTEPARSAPSVSQGFTDSLVAQVPNPTAMAIAPDGRLFVTQKGNNNGIGRVRVIKKGQLLSKPFLICHHRYLRPPGSPRGHARPQVLHKPLRLHLLHGDEPDRPQPRKPLHGQRRCGCARQPEGPPRSARLG